MDEKKVKEAIEALKIINLKRVHPFYDWEEMREVRDIAIEALEKQLPKKPIEKGIHFVYYKCPNCNRILPIDKNYCDCGQKLDWSE